MRIRTLLPLLALGLRPLAAGAIVTVAFDTPGQFRDASLGGTCSVAGDEPAPREIGKHLQKPGERYLPPVGTLNVEILDVDLGVEERVAVPPHPALCCTIPAGKRC